MLFRPVYIFICYWFEVPVLSCLLILIEMYVSGFLGLVRLKKVALETLPKISL